MSSKDVFWREQQKERLIYDWRRRGSRIVDGIEAATKILGVMVGVWAGLLILIFILRTRK